MNKLRHLIRANDGATAVEYAIMASLIAAAIVVVVQSVGDKTLQLFTSVVTGW